MRKRMFILPLLLALVALVVGCEAIVKNLQSARDAAVVARDEAAAVRNTAVNTVKSIEEQISVLPVDDPVRVDLEKKLVKAKEALAKVDEIITKTNTAIDVASEAIVSIETGQVTPGVSAALGALPYGGYITAGLTIFVAIQRHLRGKKTLRALRAVVQSWQEVGEDLSPDEKKEVATIQGPDTTALVHQIKTELAQK